MLPQKPQVCTSCNLNSCALKNSTNYCSVIFKYRSGGGSHVQHLVTIYLKLNSSKEREFLCSKEGYFLFLDLDPRAVQVQVLYYYSAQVLPTAEITEQRFSQFDFICPC